MHRLNAEKKGRRGSERKRMGRLTKKKKKKTEGGRKGWRKKKDGGRKERERERGVATCKKRN